MTSFYYFLPPDHIRKCFKFINSRHENMSFTYEIENNDKLPFLDILVTREDKEFTTNIYRKPTFSGLYTNFHSFLPESYKTGLCLTLLFRTYTICSDWSKLRNILIKNNFPSKFIDRCIKIFFDNLFSSKKKAVPTVPKKVVNISLPFWTNTLATVSVLFVHIQNLGYPP